MRNVIIVMTLAVAFDVPALTARPTYDLNSCSVGRAPAAGYQSRGPAPLETFTGTVSKNGSTFILRDESSKATYQLDDQQTAEKFAGKKVRVTGVLVASNNTIRIDHIEIATAR
ncbi:MAG: DUF5818 domain-containing protein [Candidatus Acidiferrales bacterium]